MNQRARFYTVIGFVIGIILIFWFGFGMARYSCGAKGFRLPPGDAGEGLVAFIELGCSNCHSVEGEEAFARTEEYEGLLVPLGGKVRVVKTYGELVTSIIHPSESIRPDINKQYVDVEGRSLMPDLTAKMTTRQLINIVTYLEGHYELLVPEYPANYYPYGGGSHP